MKSYFHILAFAFLPIITIDAFRARYHGAFHTVNFVSFSKVQVDNSGSEWLDLCSMSDLPLPGSIYLQRPVSHIPVAVAVDSVSGVHALLDVFPSIGHKLSSFGVVDGQVQWFIYFIFLQLLSHLICCNIFRYTFGTHSISQSKQLPIRYIIRSRPSLTELPAANST